MRYSWWSILSVAFHVPWLYWFVWVLRAYATANGPVAGEVWLLPAMWFMSCGTVGGACGIAALVSIHQSEDRLRGQWLAWTGVGLTVLFPISGLFWGDLIRWV